MVVIRTGFAAGVSIDASRVLLAFKQCAPALYVEIRKALVDIAAEHQKRVKTRFKSWTPGRKPVPEIQLRDGALRNSFRPPHESGTDLNSLRMVQIMGRTANGRPYALAQEEGKIIEAGTPDRPRMTVPLDHILDKRGRVLDRFRIVRASEEMRTISGRGLGKRRGMGFPGASPSKRVFKTRGGLRTFIWKRPGGGVYIAARDPNAKTVAARRKIMLLYTLRSRVQLLPRLRFGAEWDDMRAYQEAALSQAVERAISGLGEGA